MRAGARKTVAGGTVVVLAALGFLAAPALSTHQDNPVLEAIVGTNDGFDIGLFFPNGTRVATLAPGTYTIVVHDRSKLHNFHLASNFDPTVDFRTDVDFVGDRTFTATFRPNTEYAYACEPHWQIMNGSFRTTGGPGTTTEPTTTAPPPSRVTLRAEVSPAGRVAFRPLAVRAGPVRVVVRDRSRRFDVHLRGAGVNRRTGAAFVGTRTWTLTLRRGAYRFGTDPKPLRGILRAR
jgi:plastocyanin